MKLKAIIFGSIAVAVFEDEVPPLEISGTPATAVDGSGNYSFTPTVVGGTTPYTFSLQGTLPVGWSFNTATGMLSKD